MAHDAILTPIRPGTVFKPGHSEPFSTRLFEWKNDSIPVVAMLGWIAFATALHRPSIAVQAGRTTANMPVGVQVAGPPNGEDRLFDFAAAVKEGLDGFVAPKEEPVVGLTNWSFRGSWRKIRVLHRGLQLVHASLQTIELVFSGHRGLREFALKLAVVEFNGNGVSSWLFCDEKRIAGSEYLPIILRRHEVRTHALNARASIRAWKCY
jgi:hypothetical protein